MENKKESMLKEQEVDNDVLLLKEVVDDEPKVIKSAKQMFLYEEPPAFTD